MKNEKYVINILRIKYNINLLNIKQVNSLSLQELDVLKKALEIELISSESVSVDGELTSKGILIDEFLGVVNSKLINKNSI